MIKQIFVNEETGEVSNEPSDGFVKYVKHDVPWYYDPNDPEIGGSDPYDLAEDLGLQECMEIRIAADVGVLWAASTVLSVDDEGDASDIDIEYFNTEAQAKAAWDRTMAEVTAGAA